MISLDLHVTAKTVRNNTYTISRSSKIYSFLKNEYRNSKEYDYLFTDQEDSKGPLATVIESITSTDTSIKIPLGSRVHTYYVTEFNHTLPEDRDHNIIVPEDCSFKGRIR